MTAVVSTKARDLLLSDLARPWTIADLARRTGLNEKRLKTGFRAAFGKPVYRFLQEARLSEARRLLEEEDASVTDAFRRLCQRIVLRHALRAPIRRSTLDRPCGRGKAAAPGSLIDPAQLMILSVTLRRPGCRHGHQGRRDLLGRVAVALRIYDDMLMSRAAHFLQTGFYPRSSVATRAKIRLPMGIRSSGKS